MMINIRQDLIEKELKSDDFTYHKFNLHNSLISKLRNHYKLVELWENFYDNEDEYDDEEFDRYMTYNSILENNYHKYHSTDCTNEELKQAYKNILQQRKDYEPYRIEFCNWQEPYFKGNWGMSQKYVDNLGRNTLKEIKRTSVSNKDRLYIGYKDNQIRIYFYGRDFMEMDYWLIYERRNK